MRWRISSVALAVSLALAGGAYAAPAGGQPDKRGTCAAQKHEAGGKASQRRKACGKRTAFGLAGKAGGLSLAAPHPARKGAGGTAAGPARQRALTDARLGRLKQTTRGALDAKRVGPGGRLAKEAGGAADLLRAGKRQRRAGPFASGSRAGSFLGETQRKLAGQGSGNRARLDRMLAGPNQGRNRRAGPFRSGHSVGSVITDHAGRRGVRRPGGAWDYAKSSPGTEALGRIFWEGAWGAGAGALAGAEGGPAGMAVGAGIGGGVALLKAAAEELLTELGHGPQVTHEEPRRPGTLGQEYEYQRTETRTNGKVHIYRGRDGSEAHVVEEQNGERRIEYSKDGSVYAVEKYDRSGRLKSYSVYDSQSRRWVTMEIEGGGTESDATGGGEAGSGGSGDDGSNGSDEGGSGGSDSGGSDDKGSDDTGGDSGDDDSGGDDGTDTDADADDGQAQAGTPRPDCGGGPAASRPGPDGGCGGFKDPRQEEREREERKAKLTRAWTGQPTPERGGGGSGGGCGRDDPYAGECVEPRGGPGWAADPGDPSLEMDRRPADGGGAALLEKLDWAVDPAEGF